MDWSGKLLLAVGCRALAVDLTGGYSGCPTSALGSGNSLMLFPTQMLEKGTNIGTLHPTHTAQIRRVGPIRGGNNTLQQRTLRLVVPPVTTLETHSTSRPRAGVATSVALHASCKVKVTTRWTVPISKHASSVLIIALPALTRL
jgi:hypothetical protein